MAVLLFATIWIGGVIFLSNAKSHYRGQVLLLNLVFAVLLPLAIFHWLIGFVTFQHHTHPKVPWYSDRLDWSFFLGQVRSTVHVELPRPIEIVLHNILDHTAHHVDPAIPLYNLHQAQRNIRQAFETDIVVAKWNWLGFREVMRRCKLYDYTSHRWLDWDGKPTTESLLEFNRGLTGGIDAG